MSTAESPFAYGVYSDLARRMPVPRATSVDQDADVVERWTELPADYYSDHDFFQRLIDRNAALGVGFPLAVPRQAVVPPTSDRLYLSIKDFRELGFLQEANRRFFHPLGLALEVVQHEDGSYIDSLRVWDCRDDPEGIVFVTGDDPVMGATPDRLRKRANVEELARIHREPRLVLFGHDGEAADYPDALLDDPEAFLIQPLVEESE